jgi:Ca2+/Na+ antiporter
MHDIKLAASAIATAVALVAYVPYLIDMFRGKNRPHLYTWISIFLITAVVAYIQLIGGAGVGAIPTILGVGVDAVILYYCFRFGTRDVVFLDKVCLGLTIVGVMAYLLLQDHPATALIIVTAAEIISFVPTFRKTRNDPYSESLPSYYLLMLKLTLILIALEKYNWLTVSYSALWLAVFVVFLSFTYRWRTAWRGKHPVKTEEAPLI